MCTSYAMLHEDLCIKKGDGDEVFKIVISRGENFSKLSFIDFLT